MKKPARPKLPEKIFTLGFGWRKPQPKLWRTSVAQAEKDKDWANRTKYDREWLASASDMSLDMLYDYVAKSVEELAEKHYGYWFYRAHLEQKGHAIDPAERKAWIEAGGKIEDVGAREIA